MLIKLSVPILKPNKCPHPPSPLRRHGPFQHPSLNSGPKEPRPRFRNPQSEFTAAVRRTGNRRKTLVPLASENMSTEQDKVDSLDLWSVLNKGLLFRPSQRHFSHGLPINPQIFPFLSPLCTVSTLFTFDRQSSIPFLQFQINTFLTCYADPDS